jgi:predicted dehydrogenase
MSKVEKTLNCAVIGLGYWGPNILRNLTASPRTKLAAICDLDRARLAQFQAQYSVPLATQNVQDLLNSDNIDAIFIATPVSTHHHLGMASLRAGKHTFIEKPLAANEQQATELVKEAEARKLCLMVDHIFVYSSPVRKMRELMQSGEVGQPLYYDSVRVNLGLFQHDVNVIWDLIVHDLAIVDYLFDIKPKSIMAQSRVHVPGQPESVAYVTCIFDDPMIAHFHVNWLAPVKLRRTLLGGSRRMIVYDDLEPDEKIKVYDRGLELPASAEAAAILQVGYRLGDMFSPMLDRTEALRRAIEHFAACVETGAPPVTDGHCGLRIVRQLEAASRSCVEGVKVALE